MPVLVDSRDVGGGLFGFDDGICPDAHPSQPVAEFALGPDCGDPAETPQTDAELLRGDYPTPQISLPTAASRVASLSWQQAEPSSSPCLNLP